VGGTTMAMVQTPVVLLPSQGATATSVGRSSALATATSGGH